MPKSLNKVMLIGNLGKDPQVNFTPGGMAIAKFTLATNERFKDKSGEWRDRTEWHNIVAWQRLAEIVGEYLKKGSKIYIEGRLQTSSWEDKQSGEKKYRTEIVASDMVMLSSAASSESQKASARATDGGYEEEEAHHGTTITDEDIPF